MKILKSILLLIVLAGVTLIANRLSQDLAIEKQESKPFPEKLVNSNSRTNYTIEARYNPDENCFRIDEQIEWQNVDSKSIDTLFFNLPISNLNNSDENALMKPRILSFKINEVEITPEYIFNISDNFIDSSLVKVILPNLVESGKKIFIEIKYDLYLPIDTDFNNTKLFGFENWYVTISPVLNGKSIHYPHHNYIEPFLEYSNFNVTLEIPNEFNVASSTNLEISRGHISSTYFGTAYNITRFNWFAFSELDKYTRTIEINNNEIEIVLYINPSKDDYNERYFDATSKYLSSLSEFLEYPHKQLTIVSLPNSSKLKNKSFPKLVSIHSALLSPIKSLEIEYQLAKLLSEQYFGYFVTSNCLEEAWLTKGVSAFLAEKILKDNYGDYYSNFTVGDYYPIYGLNFLTYAGIPIIYTISDHKIPEGARYIEEYYDNQTFSDLSIPNYKKPNYEAHFASSVVKPQLALLTLEKVLGPKDFKKRLMNYFYYYYSKYPNSNNFKKIFTDGISDANLEFYNELFETDKSFDYAIKYIKERDNNIYDIMLERVESGVSPIELNVYRENDTLKFNWDGKERFKVITLQSESIILSAEIDCLNENILDLNFANNSYVIAEQHWGSISYATRVFFWFQNALMLIGSKG